MRPELLNPLFRDVATLPGVGPAFRRDLDKAGVARIIDLLLHWPMRWERTRLVPDLAAADAAAEATGGERIAIPVRITAHQPGHGRAPYRVLAEDKAGAGLAFGFFGAKAAFLARRFPVGAEKIAAGRLERWRGAFQILHPEEMAASAFVAGEQWEAIYPLAGAIGQRRFAALVREALALIPMLPEWIEPGLFRQKGWPAFAAALWQLHGAAAADDARDRLSYDELLASQLAWALVRARRTRKRGLTLKSDHRIALPLLRSLPFQLTGGQRQALAEIAGDMAGGHAMLRLLQGDVGSGKTVVALLALLIAVEAGAQGALLAPTDLLARQHYDTVAGLLRDLPVRVAFLSGRDKGKARAELLARLEAGEIDILVGTHALFSADVRYRRLGLAVIDEQHRFGVTQRMMLAEKAEAPPHLLVMTATPIPRTLALANYGEMDVSSIRERPPGRKPIDTRIVPLSRLPDVFAGLARHVEEGGQAYWVCPLLEPSDEETEGAPTPAITRAEELRQCFPGRVGLVHGRMKAAERDREMARFAAGETRILVATTVIEVGVDVPNASWMVIEAAERFGLAQLHQLRGRVGRGSAHSVCLLLRGEELSAAARERLTMLRATEDGFRIAEADLRLRGAGELLGTRQSGGQGFRLASLEQIERLLPVARDDARLLAEQDPELRGARGAAARILLYLFEQDQAVATLRGG